MCENGKRMNGARPEPPVQPTGDGATSKPSVSRTPSVPDYELLRCIGQGSYGEVWLARDALGVWRALKVIYRRNFEHDRPFEREFEGIRKFDPVSREHPSQLHVLHVGRNDTEGYFYYVMELADSAEVCTSSRDKSTGLGESTAIGGSSDLDPRTYVPHTLQLELYRRSRLPVDECLRIALSLTTALEHLHEHGLVHRDIKPSNIIFVKGVPKLADIGLVANMNVTMSFVGTSGFFPPEGPGTPRGDLFSLGKVLYEIAMGRDRQEFPKLPADLENSKELKRLLELNAVIMKACQSDPRQRYQRAGEMAADLLLLQRGHSVRRLRAVERRLALVTKAIVAITAMLVLAAGLHWNTARQARATARQLYVADMNRAFQAWEDGNVRLADELLELHRQSQPEMLGFEWRLIKQFCDDSDSFLTLRGHQRTVWAVAFAPDEGLLATGSGDGTVKLWQTATGDLLHTLRGHQGGVHAVAFSPDGLLLASGSRDFTIKLWEVRNCSEVTTLTGHTDAIRALAFSPDGSGLVSGGEDSSLRWWEPFSGKQITCADAGLKVEKLAFSPDGQMLAVCGSDIRIHFWNAATHQKVGVAGLHQAAVLSVAYSPDGQMLASGSFDGTIRLWDRTGTVELAVLGRGAPVRCVAFAPGGRYLAGATEDGLLRLWDVSRHAVLTTLRGHTANVRALAFSSGGGWLASGDEDCTAKLWQLGPSPGFENALIHTGIVNSLAFCPDGNRLVSTDPNVDTLRLWDLASRKQVRAKQSESQAVWCVAVAPDGQTVATGGVDASVRVWNTAELTQRAVCSGHTAAVDTVTFSPDSRLIASGSRDFTVRVWDPASGRELHAFNSSAVPTRAVRFAPDAKTLVSGGTDGAVRFWGVNPFRSDGELAERQGEVRAIAFSPDGRILAVGGADRTLRLYSMQQRTRLGTLPGHSAMVSSLAFSGDGRTLVSGSWDSTVKLWNVRLLREVGTLKAHSGQITQVGFSPKDDLLASASSDGTVRLWRAVPGGLSDSSPRNQ